MRRFLQDKGRTKKPQLWTVSVRGKKVSIQWGQLNGKMQRTVQTFDKPLNIGKKNEKSALVQAKEFGEREVNKRIEKGYREVNEYNEYVGAASSEEIDFARLPEHLRFYKPQNSMNVYCQKLLEKGEAWLTRKRDGNLNVISFDEEGEPCMHSSSMKVTHKDEPDIPIMDKYPHIREELLTLRVPPKSILLGELVTCVKGGFSDDFGMAVDDFEHVESVVKSKTPLALKKQKRKGRLGFCIWDIGFWGGSAWVESAKAEDRYNYLRNIVKNEWVSVPELILLGDDRFTVDSAEARDRFELEYEQDDVTEDMLDLCKAWGWEGYVVFDPNSLYGDKAFSMHGKPERPKFVCKLKPKYEADFIVRWDPDNGIGRRGKGKKSVGVGSVQAYLWDPEEEKEVEVSLVGGGLKDKDVKRFANPKLFPRVWAIEFDSMTPKGSLRFPEFLRDREDKELEECTFTQIPKKFLERLE